VERKKCFETTGSAANPWRLFLKDISSQTQPKPLNTMAKLQQKAGLPDTLLFGQATDKQLDLVWLLNSQSWAAPLPVEDYVKRERALSEQELTQNGAWRTWILTTKGVPDEIVASCETFEKPILVSTKEGVQQARGYAIASVYTNLKFRGKGMATVLFDQLKIWLDGEGDGAVCVLYSDIGKVCLSTWSFTSELAFRPLM
jgi:hypothetical protein